MDKQEEDSLKLQKFNMDILAKNLEEVNKNLADIPTEAWNNAMLEFVKIFNQMGSAMSMAFNDITSKVGIVRRNCKTWGDLKGGIITMIRHELALKIHILNGENPKLAPDPKYAGYESTARTVLRLMWFLDFTSTMLSNINDDRKIAMSSAAKNAYNVALGPHHPLLVRTGAGLAMMAAPNRDKLLGGLFPGETEEGKYKSLQKIVDLVAPIKVFLWKWYKENDLTNLP
jgi:hypothetical protein